jgi:lysozyme
MLTPSMLPSDNCYRLIESFEGVRFSAYQDVAGVWTCGYGHTIGVTATTTCTAAEAQNWLKVDVAWAETCVNIHVSSSLTQDQFDALVSFVFNVGCKAFADSLLLRLLNAGCHALAAAQFTRWDEAGGKPVDGLLRRRESEQALFRGSADNG